jgi:signal transduction histidine kinase/CheY-like chemotaxis protein
LEEPKAEVSNRGAPSSEAHRTLDLHARLWVAQLTPMIFLLGLGSLLAVQMFRMTSHHRRAAHSAEVMAQISEVQRRLTEQEGGPRGDRPRAGQVLSVPAPRPREALDELRHLVDEDPAAAQRVDQIRELYGGRDEGLVRADERPRSPASLRAREERLDAVQDALDEMRATEARRRQTRAELAAASFQLSQVVLFGSFTLGAMALAVLSRRQLDQVVSTYGGALDRERASRTIAEQQSAAQLRQRRDLMAQQERLRETNGELERQGDQLRAAHRALEEQREALVRSNRYKSEFLANMSHELRTPLNSTLVLARLLADNQQGNLSAEQVKFAETIHAAGTDLLTLINDILDLSRIEAGKAEIQITTVELEGAVSRMQRLFAPVARERRLDFRIDLDPTAPRLIETDPQRLDQVLMNLLSNALKFTPKGSIVLRIWGDGGRVHLAVTDTGIGIRPHQFALIFEAFRQADGSIARRYGGTGLGLSISRELAHLLGGELTVQSQAGVGSTFTLALPTGFAGGEGALGDAAPVSVSQTFRTPLPPVALRPSSMSDDQGTLDPSRPVALFVDPDAAFARVLIERAHDRGWQCLVAATMEAGLALAIELCPSVILLEAALPDESGMAGLERLKRQPETRHIPVVITSASDHAHGARALGASGYLPKPASREEVTGVFDRLDQQIGGAPRRLLLVEDEAAPGARLGPLLASPGVEVVAVATTAEALSALAAGPFDCVVADLSRPGASSVELITAMSARSGEAFPPVIVYASRALTNKQEQRLREASPALIAKVARGPERLIEEASLFLRQPVAALSPEQQRLLTRARERATRLDGRHILIAEDDVRSVFALTSVLEPRGAQLRIARNGKEALARLDEAPAVDLVLMDTHMPEMDGIEATRQIRAQERWARLPIIALIDRTISGEQEACRQAGASDFLARPLDLDRLLSLLRVWMTTS